ncbi:hypothetical protein D9M71_303470 [compost metagenome]
MSCQGGDHGRNRAVILISRFNCPFIAVPFKQFDGGSQRIELVVLLIRGKGLLCGRVHGSTLIGHKALEELQRDFLLRSAM